jgi:acetate kinase
VRVLVVNAGSSTVKLALVEDSDRVSAACELEAPDGALDSDALGAALERLGQPPGAVAHRVVHGGERFRSAVLVDSAVREQLAAISDLAPLHQPRSLAALDAVRAQLPDAPAVACFDTAFHATLPPAAATYALPLEWRERHGIRRYGFHGLSHAWVARRAAEFTGRDPRELAIVSCHLGAGASLCAIAGGISVDTTMGFTPLEGMVMATRSGSVDPGALLWLLGHGVGAVELSQTLEHASGLLGLAGTADMREVLGAARAGEAAAALALEVYVHRLRGGIAAMAASLGGLDVLAFTGGIGERSPQVLELAAGGLAFLGVSLDRDRNAGASGDADVSAGSAAVRTLVIAAHEELEAARQARELLR